MSKKRKTKLGRPPAPPDKRMEGRQIHATDKEWARYQADAAAMSREIGERCSVARLFRHRLQAWVEAQPIPGYARSVDRGDEGPLGPRNIYATEAEWAECDRQAERQGVSRAQFVRAVMMRGQ